MITIILTIHVLIVLALIGVVLLQRSEGGALGMGGGGSGGGFMTGRGAANALTRTTSVLAAMFFVTSLGLAIIADRGESEQDVIEGLTGERARDPNAPTTTDDLLRTLGDDSADDATEAPATIDDASSIEEALDALGVDSPPPAAEEDAAADADTEAPAEQPASEEDPS